MQSHILSRKIFTQWNKHNANFKKAGNKIVSIDLWPLMSKTRCLKMTIMIIEWNKRAPGPWVAHLRMTVHNNVNSEIYERVLFWRKNPREMAKSLCHLLMKVNYVIVVNFYATNMSFNTIGENKILAKISEFTVPGGCIIQPNIHQ